MKILKNYFLLVKTCYKQYMHLLLDGKEVCYSDNRNLYRDITCPSSPSLESYAIGNNHECAIHRDIGCFSVENYFFLYQDNNFYKKIYL